MDDLDELRAAAVPGRVVEVAVQADVARLFVLAEVTRFQPARPELRTSRDPTWRAVWNGSLYVVDTVATRPIRSVHRVRAPSSPKGSGRRFATCSTPEAKRSRTESSSA